MNKRNKMNKEEISYEALMEKIKDITWLVEYAQELSAERIIKILEYFGTNFEINNYGAVCNLTLRGDKDEKENINYYFANIFPGIRSIAGNINGLEKLNMIGNGYETRKTSVIHFCVKGRCEILTNDGKYAFMEPGIICIESQKYKEKNFNFFEEDYEGIEISFELEEFDDKKIEMLKMFGISIDEMIDKYEKNTDYNIGKVSDKLKYRYDELKILLKENDTDNTSLLVAVIGICDLIRTGNINSDKDRLYLTKGQRKIVKDIQQYIIKNPDKDITASDLAQKWGINLISLNKYFSIMYGETVHKYIQKYRMKEAAKLLVSTEDNIAVIAGKVGYENQSKFGNVFKKIYDLTPLEYRRINKINSK